MLLQGHYQNAYVTHDFERSMQLVDERYGAIDWIVFDSDMVMTTPERPKPMHIKLALGWAGNLQMELIEPVSGYVDHYVSFLPADRSDPTPRFHHIAVRRDDVAAMRRDVERLGLPVAFEGEVPGLIFIYVDARASLGHYIEHVWALPENWNGIGWPEGRPSI